MARRIEGRDRYDAWRGGSTANEPARRHASAPSPTHTRDRHAPRREKHPRRATRATDATRPPPRPTRRRRLPSTRAGARALTGKGTPYG